MAKRQEWLLPYENPLAKRLGEAFFRGLPRVPGVYIMTGTDGGILYVGKAKDLRARLRSYKLAKPGDVSRKVIRLIHLIRAIRWEECEDEIRALLRENELLRKHRPPFNVVNTSPERYFFIGIRCVKHPSGHSLRFRLTTSPEPQGDLLFGAFKGSGAIRRGYSALLRLFWASFAREADEPPRFEFPTRLTRPVPASPYELKLRAATPATEANALVFLLLRFLRGTSKSLLPRLTESLLANASIPPFFYKMIQDDIETLSDLYEWGPRRNRRLFRHHGLVAPLIAQAELDDLLVLYRHGKQQRPDRAIPGP